MPAEINAINLSLPFKLGSVNCYLIKTHDDYPIFALKQRQVRNVTKRYGATVGKDVHPHTFRHSFAVHCVRNGWDIRRLQQVLGHSSLNVTAVYLQFNDQDIKELYEKTPF